MTWAQPSDLPPDEDAGRPPPWMISFVDLVSLLLSFMILVFAFSRLEGHAWTDAARAIRIAFGGPAWMRPDETPPTTIEVTSDLPAVDLGYLALLVDARLGTRPGESRSRRDGDRMRIGPAGGVWQGGDDGASSVQQVAAILARVGNAVIVDAHVPANVSGPANSPWEAALTRGHDVASALIDAGVAPTRITVTATARTAVTPNTALPLATSEGTPPSVASIVPVGIEIVVLSHGGHP